MNGTHNTQPIYLPTFRAARPPTEATAGRAARARVVACVCGVTSTATTTAAHRNVFAGCILEGRQGEHLVRWYMILRPKQTDREKEM